MRTQGRWAPYAAVIITAVLMWALLFMARPALAQTPTYPPPPPTTTPPPPTHTADTGFEGQHDARNAAILGGVGVIAVGAAAIGRRRARSFEE